MGPSWLEPELDLEGDRAQLCYRALPLGCQGDMDWPPSSSTVGEGNTEISGWGHRELVDLASWPQARLRVMAGNPAGEMLTHLPLAQSWAP